MLKQRLQAIVFIIFAIMMFAGYMLFQLDQKDEIIKQLEMKNQVLCDYIIIDGHKQQKQINELKKQVDLLHKKRILTSQDIKSLEKIVQVEAGTEHLKGKTLVASVVLNRWMAANKSIDQIIKEPGQFQSVTNGKYYSAVPDDETKQAVMLALEKDYSRGSLYFMNPKISSRSNVRWFRSKLEFNLKHKGHEFYKPKEQKND